MSKRLFLDVETAKGCLPDNPSKILPGIEYASDWATEAERGYIGMGISCVVVQDINAREWRLLAEKEQDWLFLRQLVEASSCVATFGGATFDEVILSSHGIYIPNVMSYDLRKEIRECLRFEAGAHSGITLDALAEANGLPRKDAASGAMAPVLWQRGERERVLNACSQDCTLVRLLIDKVMASDGELMLPEPYTTTVRVRLPE